MGDEQMEEGSTSLETWAAHLLAATEQQPPGHLTQGGSLLALRRCWQLLHDGVTPLEHDLQLLAGDTCSFPKFVQPAMWAWLLRHYKAVCQLDHMIK